MLKSILIQINDDDNDYLKSVGIAISPLLRSMLHKFVVNHKSTFPNAAPKEVIKDVSN